MNQSTGIFWEQRWKQLQIFCGACNIISHTTNGTASLRMLTSGGRLGNAAESFSTWNIKKQIQTCYRRLVNLHFFACGMQRARVVGWKLHYAAIGLAAINWGSWKKQLNAKSPWWEPATHRVQLWITPLRCLAEMGVWRRNMPLNRWNHWCDRSHVWNYNPKWKALLFQSTRHNASLAVLHQHWRLVSYSTPRSRYEW